MSDSRASIGTSKTSASSRQSWKSCSTEKTQRKGGRDEGSQQDAQTYPDPRRRNWAGGLSRGGERPRGSGRGDGGGLRMASLRCRCGRVCKDGGIHPTGTV